MRARRTRNDAGVTTVEFALVFPMFVLLMGIGFYFAWLFYVQSQVDSAADRAARYAAVPYSTSTQVEKTIDGNGNVTVLGALPNNTPAGSLSTYTVTEQTTTYHFCVPEIVTQINTHLANGVVSDADVTVSDGSGIVTKTAGSYPACSKPNGYVRVEIKKNFTNPFSWIVAPFTGTSNDMTITGTGRARVEAE